MGKGQKRKVMGQVAEFVEVVVGVAETEFVGVAEVVEWNDYLARF